MPRQNRRRVDAPDSSAAPRRPGVTTGERVEAWRGRDYVVRSLAGAAAGRVYRCPGCDQEVRAGQPHVVVWAADDPDAEDRRHWHTSCWAHRDRRAPVVLRSRSAPRY